MSFDDERQYLKKISKVFYRHSATHPNFMFAPTFSCQLRCTYCYESHMIHRENAASKKTMTSEHVGSAYEAIEKIEEDLKKSYPGIKSKEASTGAPQRVITLYGGEPLIAGNYPLVREIVEEGIKRTYRVMAITNGYDLLKYEDLLGPDKIYKLQITVDGARSVHNKRRFTQGGLPTFDRTIESIQLALDKGCIVSVRTNVDADNMSSLSDLKQLYIEKGWNKNPNFQPYAFDVQWGKGERAREKKVLPMKLLEYSKEVLDKPEDELKNIIRVDFNINNSLNALLNSGKIPSLRPYFCGSTFGNYIFGPDGCIYACWDEVGLEEGKIGTYMPQLTWNEGRIKEWRDRTIDNIPECLDCAYALLCGGGCGRQAKVVNGVLLSPYCHQYPETFQHVVPAAYEQYIKRRSEHERAEENKEPYVCS